MDIGLDLGQEGNNGLKTPFFLGFNTICLQGEGHVPKTWP